MRTGRDEASAGFATGFAAGFDTGFVTGFSAGLAGGGEATGAGVGALVEAGALGAETGAGGVGFDAFLRRGSDFGCFRFFLFFFFRGGLGGLVFVFGADTVGADTATSSCGAGVVSSGTDCGIASRFPMRFWIHSSSPIPTSVLHPRPVDTGTPFSLGCLLARRPEIAIIDDGGLIVRANRTLCALLGYTDTELIGCPIQDLIHPDGHEHLNPPDRSIHPIDVDLQ